MNRCQHFNNIIKKMGNMGWGGKMLPREYQQVEYLLNDTRVGNYINTGVAATTLRGFEVKIRLDYMNDSDYRFGCGCNNNQNGNIYICTPGANKVEIYIRSGLKRFTTTGEDHVIEYLNNTLKIDGTVSGTVAFNPGDSTIFNLFSFGIPENNQTYTKIYYFRAYGTSGLLRDMYPCYRKSDHEPGMYDIVTNTFYTNAGSGEFITGNPI